MKTTSTFLAVVVAFSMAVAVGACIGGPEMAEEEGTAAALEGAELDGEGLESTEEEEGEGGGGPEALMGDMCPDKKNSVTVCTGQALCVCAGARYITSGACHDVNCFRQEARNATDACTIAAQEVPDPGNCATGCLNGAVGAPDTTQTADGCCTATKVRGCEKPPRPAPVQ